MRLVLVSLLVLATVSGCCGQPASFRAAAVAAPAAAAPCVAAAPAPVTYAAPQPVAMEYRVGAPEVTKAALQVPGNVVICAGNFLRCAVEALFPVPQPSAYAIYAAPQAVQVPMAPAAAPCR